MKSVAIPLILILAAFVAAQVPASLPSSAPSTEPVPQTAPATFPAPVTPPTTEADTQPTSQATAGPLTFATSSPTTGPATTAPSRFATSAPSYRPFSSYSSSSYSRRDYFRPNSPATTSASIDAINFKPKRYPLQYSAMLSRSIFLKGSQRVFDPGPLGERTRGGNFNPSATSPNTQPSSYGSESILVFNGASDANGTMVAFIENTGMNQIARYHVGDAVGQGAAGRVTAITLDSINYSVGPRVTHVGLGQNLNGQDVQILTTQPVASTLPPAGGAPGTTQSSSTGTPDGLSDIERRMRERRMKELGQ